MNILAVDASSSCSGVVLFIKKAPVKIEHHVSNKKDDLGKRLSDFGRFLHVVKGKTRLDYVAILKASMSRNMNTVRMIAYFESVALTKAGEWSTPTYIINDKSARKKALGNGAFTKEEAYDILKDDYYLSKFNEGGSDESDALTAGFALIADLGLAHG